MLSFLQDRLEGTYHLDYDCNFPKAFLFKKRGFFSILKFLITIVITLIISSALHFSLLELAQPVIRG